MRDSTQQARRASPFGRGATLAVVLVGFIAFVAMMYFIAIGDTGGRDRVGTADGASNGLNGYSALVELLEADGYSVDISRRKSGFDTYGLLVLTPPNYTDPEEFGEILKARKYVGRPLLYCPNGAPGECKAIWSKKIAKNCAMTGLACMAL